DFDKLCRTPNSHIIADVVRVVQQRRNRLRNQANSLNAGKEKRRDRGSCSGCRAQNYEYCMHCVLLDSSRKCTQPLRTANKANGEFVIWFLIPIVRSPTFCLTVVFKAEDAVNCARYSVEYRFADGCVSSVFLEQIRNEGVVYDGDGSKENVIGYFNSLFEGKTAAPNIC